MSTVTARYTVAISSVGWYDNWALSAARSLCGHRHRSLRTAILCDERHQPRQSNTRIDTRILRDDPDTGLEYLTEEESDEWTSR